MRQVIIRHDNALARPLTSYGPVDCVEVIVTNLPFGGMEADGIEQNFPASFRTRETADLFLVLIMRSLKERGRAAVVLPDGFLFGEGIKAGNYNLDLKNPHNADTGPGPGPGPGKVEDLPEYEKLLGQITETRSALKAQLMDALNR